MRASSDVRLKPEPRDGDASGGPIRIAHTVVGETDGYSRAVRGIHIEAVRVGSDRGPNRVSAAESASLVVTSCRFGIPFATKTTLGDGTLVVARIDAVGSDSRSRWCGIDLAPGMILAYSPGAEHTATNRPGLQFTFVTTTVDQINEYADRLQTFVRVPERGQVQAMDRPITGPVDRAFSRLSAAMRTGEVLPRPLREDVLASLVGFLEGPAPSRTVGGGSGIDSRDIVRRCMDYADLVQRIPSVGELCLASHVSERRLRQAFTDQFDMPPTRFFRTWALGLARRRLRAGEVNTITVSRVATDIGFNHLGRFSTYYRTLYGETPSKTLRATASSARAK